MYSAQAPRRNGNLTANTTKVMGALADGLRRRSAGLVSFLETRINLLIAGWIWLVLLAGTAKVAVAGPHALAQSLALMFPYLLIAVAPVAGYRIAEASFPIGLLTAQPEIRLSRYGNWRPLDPLSARGNPSFGPIGFMASLLFGILLNVPTRTLEYLAAVPAVSREAPHWAQTYFAVMTADVIVMSFFYMVCFVLALRSNPLFPRMLLFAWAADIMMQLIIAQRLSLAGDLPGHLVEPLVALLRGNVIKVLISAFVWLPYLILSERVNVTYRCRTMRPA
jgi:hypothetical protein